MARLRAVAAAATVLVMSLGAPLALLLWGRSPAGLAGLFRPDDGTAVLAVLTLAGWLAWAVVAASVVAELINLIGRRAVPLRIPLLGGLQSAIGALVFAALSSSVAPALALAQAAPTAPAAAGMAEDSDQEVAPSDSSSATADGGYVVRAGEDLWSIAEQVLGRGDRWRLLAQANPEVLADPTVDLTAGLRLALPALPDEVAGRPARAQDQPRGKLRSVRVVAGDTLSGLAKRHLGEARRWPRIARANADQIQDPDLIRIGWKLVIPAGPGGRSDQSGARPVRKQPRIPDGSGQEPSIGPVAPQPVATPSLAAQPPAAQPSATVPSDPAWPLIGGLSGTVAAMILAGLAINRLGQLRVRPVGRRISHPPIDLRRYETALGRREQPQNTELLERALRTLGAHAHASGHPLPRLRRAVVNLKGVVFEWVCQPVVEPPAGFTQTQAGWRILRTAASRLRPTTHPVPFPALVTVGRDADGNWIMLDLESRSPLALSGPPALRTAVAAAMAVELSCSPWSAELSLTVVGGDEMFVRAACPELVRFHADPNAAFEQLAATVAERDADDSAIVLLRVDPDRAEAGAGQVVLVADELPDAERTRFADLLSDPDLGVAGVLASAGGAGVRALNLSGSEQDPQATVTPEGWELRPQLIPTHTRAAIGTIFAATDEAADQPAPWWSAGGNVRPLVPRRETVVVREPAEEVPDHPYLQLIGPVELLGAAGPTPTRSRRQCEEYCAWLLENPGSSATQMTRELIVAESTRRSNMSRLRSWLGADADGRAYLPEAYSGRIQLHEAVESDWQRVQILTAPGLNRLAPETLVRVLEFVRGAPLADAAPGQWHWAEELRTDISSLVRDAGVLLARWARQHQDVDVARWAAARALLAAPEDEPLLVERINTEVLAGNSSEVHRLVRWVTSQARVLGVDLAPETVLACQRALEGRPRLRADVRPHDASGT